MAVLGGSAAGCALEPREGDGLNADAREVQISPALTDAGRPTMMSGTLTCKQLEMFTQVVLPLLTMKHEAAVQPDVPDEGPQACSDCHAGGTKPKAPVAAYIDPLEPMFSCISTLAREIQKHDVLASSNPARPDVDHEFKFKNVADYNRFHDAVTAWLSGEGVAPTP